MRKAVRRTLFSVGALVVSCVSIPLNGCAQTSAQPELVLQLGHSAEVSAIRFSPDGLTLATGSYDNTVKLWDTQSNELKRTLPQQESLVQSVSFSPDGKIVASAGGVVELREVGNGKLLRALKGNGSLATAVAFSANEAILAIGRFDGTVALWDVAQSKYLKTFTVKNAEVESVAFSLDGSTVAAGCWFPGNYSGQVRLWGVKTGRALPSLGYESGAEGVEIAFSPDKKTLAVTSTGMDVQLWNWKTAKLSQTLSWDSAGSLNHIAFSPDGKQLATGGFDNAVRLWNIASGKKTHAITKVDGIIESLAFSPDGKSLLCGTSEGDVKFWETKKWQPIQGIEGNNVEINAARFSPNGKTMAVGIAQRRGEAYYGGTQVWDVANGQFKSFLTRKNHSVQSVAFASDGKILAGGEWEGGILIWDLPTGKLLKTLMGHQDMVTSLSFLENRNLVSMARDGNEIKIWDAGTGKSKVISFGGDIGYGTLASLVASPDGKLLAVAGDENVQIYNRLRNKVQRKLPASPFPLRSLSFSPDSSLLATTFISITGKNVVSSVQLWDVASGKLRRTLAFSGEDSIAYSLDFSADGKTLISGGDKVRVWNVASGKLLRSWALPQSARAFPIIALSRDGKILSTGGNTSAVEIRSLEGKLTATFISIPDKKSSAWIAFTPEGYYDASPEGEKFIRWRAEDELFPAAKFKAQFHRPEIVKKALSGEN